MLVGETNTSSCCINGKVCDALYDTGSQVTTVTEEYWRRELKDCELQSLNAMLQLTGAAGQNVPYIGFIAVTMSWPELSITELLCPMLVVPSKAVIPGVPVIIGTNVLRIILDQLLQTCGVRFLQTAKLSDVLVSALRVMTLRKKHLNSSGGVLGYLRAAESLSLEPGAVATVTYRR